MNEKPSKKRTENSKISKTQGARVLALLFGVCALGYAVLSFLDERRERIRREKLEDAERIAEILSAPLSKYDDDIAYEKALEVLEKKYGK